MEDTDRSEYLDQFTTLDDAKKEIARLLAIEEKAYSFLHLLCNYDIKEPLLAIKAYNDLLRRKDLVEHHPDFVNAVANGAERIHKRIDVVRDVNHINVQLLQAHYPNEAVDLNSLLAESILLIKNKTAQQKVKLDIEIKMAENLPTAQANNSMLKDVFLDVAWFLTDRPYADKTEMHVITTFNEQYFQVNFGFSTTVPHPFTVYLEQFRKFENSSTFFQFYTDMLFLYKSWLQLQMYNGKLSFDVQDKTNSGENSTVDLTISLKR